MNTWQPIETLDRKELQFVLVYEDEAMRALLWNPRGFWEHPFPIGAHVEDGQTCSNPTHWMELPDPPQQAQIKEGE